MGKRDCIKYKTPCDLNARDTKREGMVHSVLPGVLLMPRSTQSDPAPAHPRCTVPADPSPVVLVSKEFKTDMPELFRKARDEKAQARLEAKVGGA